MRLYRLRYLMCIRVDHGHRVFNPLIHAFLDNRQPHPILFPSLALDALGMTRHWNSTTTTRTITPSMLIAGLLTASLLLPMGWGVPTTTANATPATSPFGSAGRVIQLSADNQQFTPEGQTILSGHVIAGYKNFKITADKSVIDMGADGDAAEARFTGTPIGQRTVNNKVDEIKAEVIRLMVSSNSLRAEGNVETTVATVASNPVKLWADSQEFNNNTHQVSARGNVRVDMTDTKISSQTATLWVTEQGKANKAVFTGNANIAQKTGTTRCERLTLLPESGNMLAETHVASVINSQAGNKGTQTNPSKMRIESDYQQYDKNANSMLASGNVRIQYGDYNASGPKATFRMVNGEVDSIILSGRPKIVTSNREVTANQIVILTKPIQRFDATGNVKSRFLSRHNENAPTLAPAAPAKPTSTGPKSGKAAKVAGVALPKKGSLLPPKGTNGGTTAPSDDYLD